MAKENDKPAANAPAATTETTKKRPPRMVDENIAEREAAVIIDVKEATLDAALKFINKAVPAAKGDPYNGVTVKGTLKVYAEEE